MISASRGPQKRDGETRNELGEGDTMAKLVSGFPLRALLDPDAGALVVHVGPRVGDVPPGDLGPESAREMEANAPPPRCRTVPVLPPPAVRVAAELGARGRNRLRPGSHKFQDPGRGHVAPPEVLRERIVSLLLSGAASRSVHYPSSADLGEGLGEPVLKRISRIMHFLVIDPPPGLSIAKWGKTTHRGTRWRVSLSPNGGPE